MNPRKVNICKNIYIYIFSIGPDGTVNCSPCPKGYGALKSCQVDRNCTVEEKPLQRNWYVHSPREIISTVVRTRY